MASEYKWIKAIEDAKPASGSKPSSSPVWAAKYIVSGNEAKHAAMKDAASLHESFMCATLLACLNFS